jgi:hypothetical protein
MTGVGEREFDTVSAHLLLLSVGDHMADNVPKRTLLPRARNTAGSEINELQIVSCGGRPLLDAR